MAISFKQILAPAQVDDVEAAQRRQAIAEAMQQRAMQPNLPQVGGPVQAKYGAGNALVDLANSLASAWNLKNANTALGRAKEARAGQVQDASKRVAMSQPNMPMASGPGEIMSPLTPEEASADLGRAMGPEGQTAVAKALMERKLSETDPNALADRELKAYQIKATMDERRAAREDRAAMLREQIASREQMGKDANDLRRELANLTAGIQRDAERGRNERADADRKSREETAASKAAAKGPDVTSPEAAQEFLRMIKDKDGNDSVPRLIEQSTGSGIGYLIDKAGDAVGYSTEGAKAGLALKSRAADIVRTLLGGRYGSGISNADREALERLAATVDDTTLARETRMFAWNDLKGRMELAAQQRSGTIQRPGSAQPAAAPPAAAAGAYDDPNEEAAYQAWKKSQGL